MARYMWHGIWHAIKHGMVYGMVRYMWHCIRMAWYMASFASTPQSRRKAGPLWWRLTTALVCACHTSHSVGEHARTYVYTHSPIRTYTHSYSGQVGAPTYVVRASRIYERTYNVKSASGFCAQAHVSSALFWDRCWGQMLASRSLKYLPTWGQSDSVTSIPTNEEAILTIIIMLSGAVHLTSRSMSMHLCTHIYIYIDTWLSIRTHVHRD